MNIYGMRLPEGSACTKIPYRGYEISVAMDDSCGTAEHYYRSDIRVYDNHGNDITEAFFDSPNQLSLRADADTLKKIFNKLDERENT